VCLAVIVVAVVLPYVIPEPTPKAPGTTATGVTPTAPSTPLPIVIESPGRVERVKRPRGELVRQVITLGSPFGDVGRPTNVSRLFELMAGRSTEFPRELVERLREPPPVPSTSIYSRTDGIAHWKACREPESHQTENIEVPGSHCGLGHNPVVLHAIADRLAQPEGEWSPFEVSGWRRLAFARPDTRSS